MSCYNKTFIETLFILNYIVDQLFLVDPVNNGLINLLERLRKYITFFSATMINLAIPFLSSLVSFHYLYEERYIL